MIDCPALHARLKGYPFGDRIPSKIKMRRTVISDFPMFLRPGEAALLAIGSETYDAWTNSYGAVAAVMPNGKTLGVKPDEFEVVEWFDPTHLPDELHSNSEG
jgi:hypothetical protein